MKTFSIHLAELMSKVHLFKVEYHANGNLLKNYEKIAYVGQRLMYPTMEKNIPYHASFKKNTI